MRRPFKLVFSSSKLATKRVLRKHLRGSTTDSVNWLRMESEISSIQLYGLVGKALVKEELV
jgi:hypothetical protein